MTLQKKVIITNHVAAKNKYTENWLKEELKQIVFLHKLIHFNKTNNPDIKSSMYYKLPFEVFSTKDLKQHMSVNFLDSDKQNL